MRAFEVIFDGDKIIGSNEIDIETLKLKGDLWFQYDDIPSKRRILNYKHIILIPKDL